MNELKGACIIGQSGGPTAVINSSALGVIQTALGCDSITRVLGAAHGIEGILSERLYDMSLEEPEELENMRYMPGSALGSCRYKLAKAQVDDTDYQRLLEVFRKYNVRYFFYNGGNDSMDTCHKISEFMQRSGYECRVIGIPKTIDNDLVGTDHCPGFGSAAKFVATACMEVDQDLRSYDKGRVTVIEIMGRHAGWLAGSAALAQYSGSGPDLVYLPEVNFNTEEFLADVTRIYRQQGRCMIAVSEGIHDADGRFIADAGVGGADVFGHTQLGGLSESLCNLIHRETGIKVRGMELSLLQRCSAHIASLTDMQEAFLAGKTAVEVALAGETGKMVAFERVQGNGEYQCRTKLINLTDVANAEKLVPRDWINKSGNGVEQEFIDYVLPLIQGEVEMKKECSLPRFARLKKILANP
ncbi:MAG: 6-phosphofructokinase [Akkermansia sp.]